MNDRSSTRNSLLCRAGGLLADGFARTVFALLAVIILIGTVGPVAEHTATIAPAILTVALALTGAALLLPILSDRQMLRPHDTRRVWFAIIVLIIFYLASRIGYLWLIDNDFRFDFLRRWEVGRWPMNRISDYVQLREFGMFFPWNQVFPSGSNFYEVTNLVHGASSVMSVLLIGKMIYSAWVGILAALIFVLWPEGLLWVQVPSHDLQSQFTWLLATWLILSLVFWKPATTRAKLLWAATALVAGAVLAWLELVRPIMLFLFTGGIAAAILAGFVARGRVDRLLALRGLAAIVLLAITTQAGIYVRDHEILPLFVTNDKEATEANLHYRLTRWYGGYAPIESVGRSMDVRSFAPYAHGEEGRGRAVHLHLSASADDPLGRLAYWARKATQVTYPGFPGRDFNFGYYLRVVVPDGSFGEPQAWRRSLLTYGIIFTTAINLFIAAGLIAALLLSRLGFGTLFPLMSFAAYVAPLLLFAEAQPRFFFALAPIGSIYAVAGFAALGRRWRGCGPGREALAIVARRGMGAVAGGIVLAVLVLGSLVALAAFYDHDRGRLVNLREAVTAHTNAASRHPYLLEMDFSASPRGWVELTLPERLAGRELTATLHTDRGGPPCTIAVIASSGDERLFAAEIAPSPAAQEVMWTQPATSRGLRIEASIDCPQTEVIVDAMILEFGFVTIADSDVR